jgi:hypothetical protein
LAAKIYALLQKEVEADSEHQRVEAQCVNALAGLDQAGRELIQMIETTAAVYPCDELPGDQVIGLSRSVLGIAARQVTSRESLQATLTQLRRQRQTRREALLDELLAALCSGSLRTRVAMGTHA